MRERRKARKMTHTELTKKLGVKQRQVPKLGEARRHSPFPHLMRSIEAMIGTLTLVAQFRAGAPVKLTSFAYMNS